MANKPSDPSSEQTPPRISRRDDAPSNGHATPNPLPLRRPGLRQTMGDRFLALRYWGARTFTSENIWSGFKTFCWVAPLTIAIWIYAEREQIATQSDVTIPLVFKSSDPGRVVRWQTQDHAITVKLSGPKSRVVAVQEALRKANESAVQIELKYPPADTPYTIDTKQVVGNQDIFNGVVVDDMKPSRLVVSVDAVANIDVSVQVPPDLTNITSAVFEPAKVHVTGPKSVLADRSKLTIIADLKGRDELNQPGAHDLAAIPVVCSIDDPSVTFQPTGVKATIVVNQTEIHQTISSIPIFFQTPQGLLEKYHVELSSPTITNVVITGPADRVANLPPLQAVLTVSDEDIDRPMHEKVVSIQPLKGVYGPPDSDPALKVSFRLVPNQ